MSTTLYIIRHAQTEANKAHIFGSDTKLTPEGVQSTERLREDLAKIAPTAVYVSDTIRAKQTAKILTSGRDVPVLVNQKVRERSYGNLEGKPVLQIHKDIHNKTLAQSPDAMWDVHLTTDDETNREALERFLVGLTEVAEANDGETVFVVTHGNVCRCFLIHLGFGTFHSLRSGAFKNNGYIKLRYTDGGFAIESVVGAVSGSQQDS